MNNRALATAVVAGSLLLGTAGCGVFTPVATLMPYSASDGVNVNVGDVKLRNVLVITDESGDASIVGTIVNDTTNVQYLTIEIQGSTTVSDTVTAAEGLTKVGIADGNPAVIVGTGLVAGEFVDIYFQYGGQDGVTATVPVLDGTDPVYAPYSPSLYAPVPVPVPAETATAEG